MLFSACNCQFTRLLQIIQIESIIPLEMDRLPTIAIRSDGMAVIQV